MINVNALRELDYGITVAAGALIKAIGMLAHNQTKPLFPHTKEDFDKIIEENGLHHNSVLSRWDGIL